MLERYSELVDRFELMQELALILNRKRVRRGSIDFDLPEPFLEFDEFGEMTGVTRAPRNIAHRMIEEFMLAANEAVASHLEAAGSPDHLPHSRTARSQASLEFEEIAAHFGYSLVGAVKRSRAIKRFGEQVIALDDRQLHFSQLPTPGQENRRQTRRADPQLPDAAVTQASPL